MNPLRTAASPRFFPRLDRVLGGVRVVVEDCGTDLRREAPQGGQPARSPALCEAEGGPCAACYRGDPGGPRVAVGEPVGRQAIQAFRVALRAYQARSERTEKNSVVIRWPSAHLGAPGGRAALRSVDLPGGLVYLADLLEARPPAVEAVLCEMDGVVRLGEHRGRRRVQIVGGHGDPQGGFRELIVDHPIPEGRALLVEDGERVRVGDALSEGHPGPQQILRILGEIALVAWFLGELVDLFSSVDVRLPERHGALLIRRMLGRVRIQHPGETSLPEGSLVERWAFFRENERILAQGALPATAEPIVLGLSKVAEDPPSHAASPRRLPFLSDAKV